MGRFAIERPGKDGQLHDRNATRVTEYVVTFSPTLQLATCEGTQKLCVPYFSQQDIIMIALDIETYDPNLKELGDGSIRKDGEILCCGSYNGKKAEAYIPNTSGWQKLIDILKSDEPKIFHNGIYDLAWLCCGYNLKVNGTIHDTMTRMSMIDEYADLDLDSCCKRFNIKGKKALNLKGSLWQNSKRLWNEYQDFRANMIKYNLQDCVATYNLFFAQESRMQNYQEAYQMECDLYPLLIEMKKNGVRIDEKRLAELTCQIKDELTSVEQKLKFEWGLTPTIISSTKQLGSALTKMGLHSPMKTPKGAESWAAGALDRLQEYEVVREIQHWKTLSAVIDKYLQGALYKSIWNGRIHCTFSPNKRDDGGTITGRFACKNPNLQNIPARETKHGHKSYGPEMRELFIPEHDCWMFACDYSQIEYLLLAHFAVGPQAEWFREQANAGVDFHTTVQQSMNFPERGIVKALNYGKMYGMGINKMMQLNYVMFSKLAADRGMDLLQFCTWINDLYNEKMPVIKDTMLYIQNLATVQGYVESIGGRYHHRPRPYFDPTTGKWNEGLYKMTNYLIQGSAADILKKGLLDAWNSGVFNTLKMHITVHDENVCSVPKTKEGVEAAAELEACMNNAYKDRLLVPMKAVGGIGDNWNGKHAEDEWQNLREKYGLGRSGEHDATARIIN